MRLRFTADNKAIRDRKQHGSGPLSEVEHNGDREDCAIASLSTTNVPCATNSEQMLKLRCEGHHIRPSGETCISRVEHGRPKGTKAIGLTLESASRSSCHDTDPTLIADAHFTRVLFMIWIRVGNRTDSAAQMMDKRIAVLATRLDPECGLQTQQPVGASHCALRFFSRGHTSPYYDVMLVSIPRSRTLHPALLASPSRDPQS
jgi:hypothetical protein